MTSPEFYDPMKESAMDDDYTPQWFVLNDGADIVEATTPDTLSEDTSVDKKLRRYAEEFHKEREGLSEYGRSLLG